MINGIIFDYGGTLDTNGIHWAEVIWEHYQKYHLPVTKPAFLDAYRFGERSLATRHVVKPDHLFYDVMDLKIRYQFEWLAKNDINLAPFDHTAIAEDCAYFARYTVQSAIPVLETLGRSYPLVMVSNFYGNLKSILKDFGALDYFKSVVESAVVGIRKPDPRIFRLGVQALELQPEDCVVVGDSFTKDIIPAKEAGCHTIWLKGVGFEGEEIQTPAEFQSDSTISDLPDLIDAVKELSGKVKTQSV